MQKAAKTRWAKMSPEEREKATRKAREARKRNLASREVFIEATVEALKAGIRPEQLQRVIDVLAPVETNGGSDSV